MHNQLIEIIFQMTQNFKILKTAQDIENSSRSQGSQMKHMINKAQELKVDEEFEDDSDYGQSVK